MTATTKRGPWTAGALLVSHRQQRGSERVRCTLTVYFGAVIRMEQVSRTNARHGLTSGLCAALSSRSQHNNRVSVVGNS
jgi:hypothetical protein